MAQRCCIAKKDIEGVDGGEIWMTNDEGKEVKCEGLFNFDSEETKKSYIVYTDDTLDEDGSTKFRC